MSERTADDDGLRTVAEKSPDAALKMDAGTHFDAKRQARKVMQGCEIYLDKIITYA